DGLGQRPARRGERASRRRLDRLAVKQQRKLLAGLITDVGALIKSFAQLRPRAAPRRLARIERLVFENLGENLSHRIHVIVRRNTGGTAADGRMPDDEN